MCDNHVPANRRSRLIPLWLAIFFALFYVASARGTLSFGDDVSMLSVTRSIATQGSVAVLPGTPGTKRGVDGRYYSKYGLGQSLLGVPFYLMGAFVQDHYSDRALLAAHPNPDANPLTFCVCLLGNISTVGAVVLLYLSCLKLGFDEAASAVAALAFGTCTFAWFYARTFMTEPTSTFFLLLAFYGLLRREEMQGYAWLCISGIGLGSAILVRLQNAIVIPAFALWLIFALRVWQKRTLMASVSAAALWSLPVLCSFGVIATYDYVRFGHVGDTGLGAPLKAILTSPFYVGLYGFLLSPGKSIFWYAPILLVAVYGWKSLWIKCPRITGLVALFVATYLLFYSHIIWWPGGGTWGPRFMVQIIPFLMIGLAALINQGLRLVGRIAVAATMALSLFIQIVSVLVSYIPYEALMDRTPETYERLLWVPTYSPIIIQSRYLIHHQFPYDLAYNAYPSTFLAHLQLVAFVGALAVFGSGVFMFFNRTDG
jgi:4-amino-4-deoxy-L-arabinose transferase-like glycosyltransferase